MLVFDISLADCRSLLCVCALSDHLHYSAVCHDVHVKCYRSVASTAKAFPKDVFIVQERKFGDRRHWSTSLVVSARLIFAGDDLKVAANACFFVRFPLPPCAAIWNVSEVHT